MSASAVAWIAIAAARILLVKATECNDTKLKQQEAAQAECLIKDVPSRLSDLPAALCGFLFRL